jgi:hypothetical protein
MNTEKDLIMFYQSTLRNVGLYTSISLAAIGSSRFYRGKSRLYNLSFIFISLIFLLIANHISYLLIQDVNEVRTNDMMLIKKWIPIPHYVIVLNGIVGLFGIYTFYREYFKQTI